MRYLLMVAAIAAAYIIAYVVFGGASETFRKHGWRR